LDGLAPRFLRAADGTKLRYATWSSDTRPRGVCAILDGQTEFLEKYCEVANELCARGYAVAALDWRGQGGSERSLPDGRKAHVRDFSEYDSDLRAFGAQVLATIARKPLALAHSMGAHILLRTLHEKPDAFAAAVLTAPLIEADTRGYPAWLARWACGANNRLGRSADWVWGMESRDPLYMNFANNLVTSDRARFARTKALIAGNPQLRLTGPTWGWLQAAYRSMARINAPGYAEAITTPVLILGAGRDRIVKTSATRSFAKRLPNATYVEFEDSEHEILMENDCIRARFWWAFDEFTKAIGNRQY
jgi:lysophospholipase